MKNLTNLLSTLCLLDALSLAWYFLAQGDRTEMLWVCLAPLLGLVGFQCRSRALIVLFLMETVAWSIFQWTDRLRILYSLDHPVPVPAWLLAGIADIILDVAILGLGIFWLLATRKPPPLERTLPL